MILKSVYYRATVMYAHLIVITGEPEVFARITYAHVFNSAMYMYIQVVNRPHKSTYEIYPLYVHMLCTYVRTPPT